MAEAARARRALRVATWNVHGCVGAGDVAPDPERVAQVVRALDADLVGLQEVSCCRLGPGGESHLAHVARVAGLRALRGTTRHSLGLHCGNALLVRPEARVEGVAVHDLSVARREPRGLLEAVVATAAGPLRAWVTHLGLAAPERCDQVARLLAHLPADDEPLVVLGDLNEWWPFGTCARRLTAALGRSARLRTFPARLPVLALDRVFALGGARVVEARVHRSGEARRASDHLPVVATVRLG